MIRAIFLGASLALAVPAAGQDDLDPGRVDDSAIGSRFKLAEEAVDNSDMRKMQKRMMRCTASGDHDLARELLQKSDPVRIDHAALSMDYNDMLEEMNFGGCLGRAMPRSARRMRISFNPIEVRNLLAEEIYLYENKQALTIGESDPEYLENRKYVGGRPYPRAQIPARLADCIVYRAPVKAHEFLDANPTTSREREAAEVLAPVVEQCLPGQSGSVSLTLAQLRSYVADGLWSRSHYGAEAKVEGSE